MASYTKIPKICIGLPSGGLIRAETVACLVDAVLHTPSVIFNLQVQIGSLVHENREEIARKALAQKATYLMFIDSDIIFPANAVSILLSRKKPIIGVNYNYRRLPAASTVKLLSHKTSQNPLEPFQVRAVGLGFTLIQTQVFEQIPRPWFFFKPGQKSGEFVGEDVWFCERAREHGVKVWCDPTVKVGHIGTWVY